MALQGLVSTLFVKKQGKCENELRNKRREQSGHSGPKAFKSRVVGLKDAVFDSKSVKHAVQFDKTLEEIADYVQVKYNNDVARMIRDVECPLFKWIKL